MLHYYEREATADLECLLCNESVNAKTNARIEHFTSFVHRVTYIVSNYTIQWYCNLIVIAVDHNKTGLPVPVVT